MKASVFQCSAFFIVQLSHLYMTTGKTKALIRHTFVGKVIPLLFNILSRFVIAFLSMSKCLISWLQSPSTVNLKSVTVSCFPPPVCHEHSTFFPALVHTLFSPKPLDKHEAPGHFMGLEKKLCVFVCGIQSPNFGYRIKKLLWLVVSGRFLKQECSGWAGSIGGFQSHGGFPGRYLWFNLFISLGRDRVEGCKSSQEGCLV